MEIGDFQRTLPSDEMLIAIGKGAVRAGQLECVLKLVIKSLLGLTIPNMIQQTNLNLNPPESKARKPLIAE